MSREIDEFSRFCPHRNFSRIESHFKKEIFPLTLFLKRQFSMGAKTMESNNTSNWIYRIRRCMIIPWGMVILDLRGKTNLAFLFSPKRFLIGTCRGANTALEEISNLNFSKTSNFTFEEVLSVFVTKRNLTTIKVGNNFQCKSFKNVANFFQNLNCKSKNSRLPF